MTALLEVERISKSFPGVRALDDVSLTVSAGEVVALLGHNGSGKSTLVKTLAGIHAADAGQIRLHGDGAASAGLHFIHQDLGLVPGLSTVENIDLVRSRGQKVLLPTRRRQEREQARRLVGRFSATFDVEAPVSTLSPVERTIVAIARALDGWTSPQNVIVLDEPTAALAEGEVQRLFDVLRTLVAEGAGVLLISHRLDEVVEIADRVVVLRDGRVVATAPRGGFDTSHLAGLVSGAMSTSSMVRDPLRPDALVALAATGLRSTQLRGLDLEVRQGEIVGVTGLLGSGVEHVGATLVGALPGARCEFAVAGRRLTRVTPRTSARAGLVLAPADRRRLGAVLSLSARENLTLPLLAPLRARLGHVMTRRERHEAGVWMDRVGVRPTSSTERPFSQFSGGNQQKIVIARWLRFRPHVFVLEEPTQGVDVGAKAGIHQLVASAAAEGAAVLICSTDVHELVAVCDRVVVLHDGTEATCLSGDDLTERALVHATLVDPRRPGAAPPVVEGTS